jgi:hypothetical protein
VQAPHARQIVLPMRSFLRLCLCVSVRMFLFSLALLHSLNLSLMVSFELLCFEQEEAMVMVIAVAPLMELFLTAW